MAKETIKGVEEGVVLPILFSRLSKWECCEYVVKGKHFVISRVK